MTKDGFHFTQRMRRLCEVIVGSCPPLGHVQMGLVLVAFNQTRKDCRHGMWASLTPMRFEHGARTTERRGQRYRVQQVRDDAGREMLYILSFYLPRFLNLTFDEKLSTVFHELWHIHPEFNGDLRRFPGRCYAHSGSQKAYDAQVAALTQQWLDSGPPPDCFAFLRLTYRELAERHGRIYGCRIRQPKLIPIPK